VSWVRKAAAAAADHRLGAGVGEIVQQCVGPTLSLIRSVALVLDVFAQHLDGL